MEPADQNEINFETMLSAEPWDYMTDSDKRNAIDCASAEIARLRAELEQARAERDKAVKRRDFAVSGEENLRYLKQLWEQECGYYRAKWWEADQANDRSRRTIAALVVAARAIYTSYREELDYTWNARDVPTIAREKIRPHIDVRLSKPRNAKQAGEG